MLRLSFSVLPMVVLAACVTPAPNAASTPQAAAAPFSVPMNPGLISCDDLSNPSARAAATDWTMGRMRAAVLAGRRDAVPAPEAVAQELEDSCIANGRDTIQEAAFSMGL